MSLHSESLSVGILSTNCYIVSWDDKTAVIDPGASPVLIAEKLGTRVPSFLFLTHTHFDHIGAIPELKRLYPGIRLCYHSSKYSKPDVMRRMTVSAMGSEFLTLYGEDVFSLGEPDIDLRDGIKVGPFTVMETPGHSADSVCLYSQSDKIIFSGDTLFYHSCGRTDFEGGNEYDMTSSLQRLLSMDGAIKVFPGHGAETSIHQEALYFGLSDI